MEKYIYRWDYREGLISVTRWINTIPNSKGVWRYGVFDENGTMILDLIYESISITPNYIVFKKDGFEGATDKKGNILFEPIYKRIDSSKYGIITSLNGIIKIFNLAGKLVLELTDEGQFVNWYRERYIKISHRELKYHTILNSTGNIILKDVYLTTFHNDQIIYLTEENGNYGVINDKGKEIIKPVCKRIKPLNNKYLITENDKVSLVDNNGKMLAEIFRDSPPSRYILEVVKNGRKYLADTNGKILLEDPIDDSSFLVSEYDKSKYEMCDRLFEEYSKLVTVTLSNQKQGIFRKDGTYVIRPVFQYLFFSSNKKGLGRASFYVRGKWPFKKIKESYHGFVCGDGTILMQDGFDYSLLYDNELLPMAQLENSVQSRWFGVQRNTKLNISAKIYISEESNFYFLQSENKLRMISKNGEQLSDILWDGIFSLNEKLFIVTMDKKMGLVNHSGHIVVRPEVDYFYPPKDGLIRFIKNGFHGVMSENGTIIIDPVYSMIFEFIDGIAKVFLGMQILDTIDSEGHSRKKDYGKEGLIDLKGNRILNPICDRISFIHNVFWYQIGSKCGVLDKLGNIILEPIFDSIEVQEHIFVIEVNNKFGVAARNGNIILEPAYKRETSEKSSFKIDTPEEKKIVRSDGHVIDVNKILESYKNDGYIRKKVLSPQIQHEETKNNKAKDTILSILSFFTGSSKENLLNIKHDIEQFFVKQAPSNYQEKKLVFQKLLNDMPVMFEIDEIKPLPMYEILARMIELYEKAEEKDFLQMLNRVLVHFYGLEFKKNNKFIEAIVNFSKDFEKFVKEFSEEPYRLEYSSKEDLVRDMAEAFIILSAEINGEQNNLRIMKRMTAKDLLVFFNKSMKDEDPEKVQELMIYIIRFYGQESWNLEAFMLDIEGYLYTS